MPYLFVVLRTAQPYACPSHVTSPLTARTPPHSQAALPYSPSSRTIVVAVCIVLLPPRATTIGVVSILRIIVHL